MDEPKHGVNWGELIKLVAPIIGGVAGGDPGHFMGGYLHQQNLIDEQRRQDAEAAQRVKTAGANFMLHVGEQGNAIETPGEYDNYRELAKQAFVHGGYGKPEDFTMGPFPASKVNAARLKELGDELDRLKKGGYDLDQLSQPIQAPDGRTTYNTLHLKDGSTVSIPTARQLTGGAFDPSGKPVAEPKKADVNASTDFGRFLAKFAKDKGKTVDTLTTQEELAAKTQYGQAGDKPASGDYTSRYLDNLVSLWKESHPGQALPLDVQRQLMIQAKKDVGQADDRTPPTTALLNIKPGSKEYRVAQDLAYGKLTMAQFRSLYSYSRDVGAKTSIYEKAAELNPAFNPAQFEMGFTLAKNPRVQQQLASMDNVREAVPDLLAASDAAQRSGITSLNRFTTPIKIAIGQKSFSNFNTARIAFADELSGALGFGSATDMSREMGFNMTDQNLSPANFRSAIQDIVIPFLDRKRKTLLDQMGIYGQQGMNPAATAPAPTLRFNPATGKVE